jgi:streptogramin lyase
MDRRCSAAILVALALAATMVGCSDGGTASPAANAKDRATARATSSAASTTPVSVDHAVIEVGFAPHRLSVADGSVWVATGADLVELDAASGEVRRTISLPGVTSAYDLAVTDDAVWVTDERGTAVSRVPLSGGAVRQVQVGAGSTGVAADGGAVWVALGTTNRMVRLDEDSGAILSRPSLPSPGLAVARVGSSVWVGVPDADLVVSFDARSGRQTRRWLVGDFPPYVVGVGVSVFVSSHNSGQVVRVPLDQR